MTPTRHKTTTERGLGWSHQQDAARLHRRHVDGELCWWCSLPMFKDNARNWDRNKLAADHTVARAVGGKRADRLLHSVCNKQRGDGRRDDQRPALTGQHPRDWRAGGAGLHALEAVALAMDW